MSDSAARRGARLGRLARCETRPPGAGTTNVCGCTETPASFCARLTKTCGAVTAKDACGVTHTYDCGTCAAGQRCVSNACVCDGTSCPSGCCEGAECKPGDVAGACWKGGRACSACWPGQTCTANACTGCAAPQDSCTAVSQCCDAAGSMCRDDGSDDVCCRVAGQECRTSGDC